MHIIYKIIDFIGNLFSGGGKKSLRGGIFNALKINKGVKKQLPSVYALSTSNRAQRRYHQKMTGEKLLGDNRPFSYADKQ